jgi:hypothetical protein
LFLNVYGGSGYAVTGGDYTVHAVLGVDPWKRLRVDSV